MKTYTLPSRRTLRTRLLIITTLGSAYLLTAQSQSSTPNTANIHPVALSADPLYAQGAGQRPTLTLALSVEFPTVGAQYRDNYDNTQKYLGYFDPSSCYSYTNDTVEANRWFTRYGSAGNNYSCNGAGFSGNFMNWATSSSIDLLRYGLTGGDRIKDTDTLTVLQRAVLQADFWDSPSYFPQKTISSALAENALPSTLRGDHTSKDIYISNCSNRVFFSISNSTGDCSSPTFANSLGAKAPTSTGTKAASNSTALSTGMFYTRVKVCDFSGNTLSDPRTTLCQKYPNGNFKPVGNMQKYSDRIRLAAFGYLMESGTSRYGGVLRAPMTYVGPRAYDNAGNALTGNNPMQEWDSNTGIFQSNPRNDALGKSGVINYLNQFGRIPGYEGVYKSNDPVGELYYESLRYLQGLGPTAEAVSNLDNAKKAGFPVYETWVDPFDGGSSTQNYACLRNSILLIGDVNTHADKSLPGNDRTTNNDFARNADLGANIPNFKDWTKVVGGFESNNAVSYVDGNGVTRSTQTTPAPSSNTSRWGMEDQGTGSGSSSAYYMAGAAYWAHTHDIRGNQWTDSAKRRPGMRITTYVLDVNEGGAQSTYNTRKQTQFFLTAKYGGFTDIDGDGNPFTIFSTDDPKGTLHWAKAANYSTQPDPKTYFLANKADELLKALDDIFIAATQVSSSIAKPALSSSQLTTADSYIYQAEFDPEYWSGDVKRRSLKLNASGGIDLSAQNQSISAAARLDALTASALANRKILVGTGNAIGTRTTYATAFKWDSINDTLRTQLSKANPSLTTTDDLAQSRLNFLRGDRTLEATTFRKRASRLGDIVNSGVAYSGAPTTRHSDAAYRTFYNTNKNRTAAIFVGANDGMLHAFNASTMDEMFAYIPSWMGPNLSTLASSDYNSSRHTSYVDATPVVAEAKVNDAWKTVLVSGTGGGGQGVFALDITSPSDFDASNVMWEFTDADDASLGNVVGQPRILKFRTNATSTAQAPTYKWFAVIPSGVNNYVEDGTGRFSSTGEPALFLLDLSKSTSDSWSLGVNYFKITFPLQTAGAFGNTGTNRTLKASGIINFEATGNTDEAVEFIYAGDLHGQMWKIDMTRANLSEADSTNWDLSKTSYFKSTSNPKPLYIAKDDNGTVQPISMVPSIAYGPFGSYIIGFGTGKYLEASDNAISTSTQIQSFYTLYDQPDSQLDTEGNARFNGKTKLRKSTISTNTVSSSSFTWVSPRNSDSTETGQRKSGWYINYPNGGGAGGEQQITNAVLFGKDIIFSSVLPPTASGSACGGGSSRTYTANLATGIGTVSNLSASAMGAPMLLQMGSTYSASGSTGDRYKTDTVGLLSPTSTGLGDSGASIQTKTADFLVGRLSWRQINNYKELKNKSWSN